MNEIDDITKTQWIPEAWYMPLFNGARYLANINSAINPMIYAAMNDDFKQNLRFIILMEIQTNVVDSCHLYCY